MHNLIGYDAIHSYGFPSYYGLAMYASYQGNRTVTANVSGTSRVYKSVTIDSVSKTIFIKLVNLNFDAVDMQINLQHIKDRIVSGKVCTLSATTLEDRNTIDFPEKVVPVTATLGSLSNSFRYRLKPYSVTMLKLNTSGRRVRN